MSDVSKGTVLITGAAKNTGFSIALKFAQEGYGVAITSRDREEAESAAERIEKLTGAKVMGYALDLENTDEINSVFASVIKDFGTISVFVGNAANLGVDIPFLDATPEQFDDVMNVNLKGTYFCCQQAAREMCKNRYGSIVIIGSVHYKQAINGRSLYSASKGGLASLTRSMAYELGKYGVRANFIVAGAIRTDRWDVFTEEEKAKRRANWPLGTESTGDDIANAVYYLGSDLSRTVTGTDLTVDSGIGICLLPFKDQPK